MSFFKKYIFFLGIGLCIIIALRPYILNDDSNRRSYSEYLQSHPFRQTERKNEASEGPQKDSPDPSWQQDFLRTQDPSLRRPAPERLVEAKKKIKAYFDEAKASRTGEESFPWIERGPKNVGGRTRAIEWDPNDPNGNKVWAGAVTGGLWYNQNILDVNEPWINIGDFWDNISISVIAFDPNNTSIMYVGTGEGWGARAARGAGIWKSTDAGVSWNHLSSTSGFYYVNDLIVRDESGVSVIYAGLNAQYYYGSWHGEGNEGLMRSIDGGDSFEQVMPTISDNNYAIADIELDANNNLWVGTLSNRNRRGGGAIFYSENGINWVNRHQASVSSGSGRVALATSPSHASHVYAIIESNRIVSKIIRTIDGGLTWSNRGLPNDDDTGIPNTDFTRGQAWYDLAIAVDPMNQNSLIAGGINLFHSTSGASTWDQVSHWYGGFGHPEVHADQHVIKFKPGSSDVVLFGHDGGVSLSTNISSNSPSFTLRNLNYNVTQFYSAAIHPDYQKNYFLAGAQDNGSQAFSLNGFADTEEVTGGDGAFCFIDQLDGNIQITSYVYNNYFISTDGGKIFDRFEGDFNTGAFINPCDYDDKLGILYTNRNNSSFTRFSNLKTGRPSQTNRSVNLELDEPTHFRVSPFGLNSSTLYIGTESGNLFRFDKANNSPQRSVLTSNDFPTGAISCVEIGPSEDSLLVTFFNYGVVSVWQTLDGGNTWVNKEGNLPDMPVRWALYNPNNYNEVILATELGIWYTENINTSSPDWRPSNEGLANVRVDMLQIRDSDQEVVAATHGRGLFTSSGFSKDVIWNNNTWNKMGGPLTTDNVRISDRLNFSIDGIVENVEIQDLIIDQNQNLIVNNGLTLVVNGDIINYGSITIESGSSLITYEKNSVTGNPITIRRNTRFSDSRYSFVGSPMQQSETIRGSTLGHNIYKYDERITYGLNGLERWFNAINDELIPGRGYTQAFRRSLEFSGVPNAGTITYDATFTEDLHDSNEGWNLVANPYASAIKIEEFLTKNQNTTGAVYFWDDNNTDGSRGTNDDYIVANIIGATDFSGDDNASLFNGKIGSSQGFFIQLKNSDNKAVVFNEEMRDVTGNDDVYFFRNNSKALKTLRIQLSLPNRSKRNAMIGLVDGIDVTSFNYGLDAPLFNIDEDFALFFPKSDHKLAITAVTPTHSSVDISIQLPQTGQFSIEFTNDWVDEWCLYDHLTNSKYPISSNKVTFNSSVLEITGRFQLLNLTKVLDQPTYKNWNIFVDNGTLTVLRSDSQKEHLYSIYDLGGNLLFQNNLNHLNTVSLMGWRNGVYFISDGINTRKFIVN